MSDVRTGISGWRYPPWRGVFYPADLPQRRELEYASRRLRTIEINGSFYSLQRPESYARWAAETPADFVFSVKGPRFVTHMKKLAGVEAPLANFFASGVLALGAKLGPVLWQLPPTLGYDPERLAGFFAQLPRSTGAAAELASRHDERMEGRALLTTPRRPAAAARPGGAARLVRDGRLRRAAAGARRRARRRRHRREVAGAARRQLRPRVRPAARRRGALRQRVRPAGAGPVGGPDPYLGRRRYPDRRGRAGPTGPRRPRDVVVYFDNDVKVRAPFDAIALADRLGVSPPDADAPAGPGDVAEEARTEWPARAGSGRGESQARRRRR